MEMKKTLILILLDESGSMSSQKKEVIRGFNEFIEDQKKIEEDKAWVIFIKFNSEVNVVLKYEPLAEVPKLEFYPDGGTALYDAIGEGIKLASQMEELFDRVICVILTDGHDNASRKLTNANMGSLVKQKEVEGKWTFIYIGEKPEVWAKQTGTSVNNSSPYNHKNQRSSMMLASRGVTSSRLTRMSQMTTPLCELVATSDNTTIGSQQTSPMSNEWCVLEPEQSDDRARATTITTATAVWVAVPKSDDPARAPTELCRGESSHYFILSSSDRARATTELCVVEPESDDQTQTTRKRSGDTVDRKTKIQRIEENNQ